MNIFQRKKDLKIKLPPIYLLKKNKKMIAKKLELFYYTQWQ